jgi:sugar phosphate isomerase/epimerase
MLVNSASKISIRDHIVPVAAGQSFFDGLRRVGTDAIEADIRADGSLPHLTDSDGSILSLADDCQIERTRRALDSHGVRLTALLLMTDFSHPELADEHEAWTVRAVLAAEKLNVPVVRIDPFTACCDLPPPTLCETFIARVRRILDRTHASSVDLGMENHGAVFNDPTVLEEVLSELPNPRFGLTLDTGNLYWFGHPISEVYRLIECYAPRTKHTHLKNIAYPSELADRPRQVGYEYKQFCCPLDEGNLDVRRIIAALAQHGYQRHLCIEDESLFKFPQEQRAEVLRREVVFAAGF